jgi:hypothetical protein
LVVEAGGLKSHLVQEWREGPFTRLHLLTHAVSTMKMSPQPYPRARGHSERRRFRESEGFESVLSLTVFLL